MVKSFDSITTERLFLRGIDETDAELIVKWRSDPAVYRYFKYMHQITLVEHNEWYLNKYMNDKNRYDWMCCEKETKRKVGVFGLIRSKDIAEVNYLLAPEAQHRGYAGEAIQSLVIYARQNWNINKVIAEIKDDNLPSISLIKKLGFVKSQANNGFSIYIKRPE